MIRFAQTTTTVFAPTDEAFARILEALLADKEAPTDHVVPGKVMSS